VLPSVADALQPRRAPVGQALAVVVVVTTRLAYPFLVVTAEVLTVSAGGPVGGDVQPLCCLCRSAVALVLVVVFAHDAGANQPVGFGALCVRQGSGPTFVGMRAVGILGAVDAFVLLSTKDCQRTVHGVAYARVARRIRVRPVKPAVLARLFWDAALPFAVAEPTGGGAVF